MIRGVQDPFQIQNRPGAGCARTVLSFLALWTLFAGSGCAPSGPTPESAVPHGPPFPPIQAVEMSGSRAREAAGLISAARDSLMAGSLDVALTLADRIIRDFPGAPGSGEALQIRARVLASQGRSAEAAEPAARLASLLTELHPSLAPMSLLAAEGYWEAGDLQGALGALELLPSSTPDSVLAPARALLREMAPALAGRDLELAAERFSASNPLRGMVAVEWGASLYLRGDRTESRRWAEVGLSGALEEREQRMAQGIVDGRLEEVLGIPLVIGALLPRTGASPGLLQYGEWVQEGIELALEEFRDSVPRPVQMEMVDDRASPLGGRTAIRSLEDFGAFGALGPLTQEVLEEAAAARRDTIPILSPFAYIPPEEAPAVYSLSGPDPGGARLVARMAAELGLTTVAVVRPETQEARVNAQAFREEYEGLGGVVPREIVFDSGGTFFQPQFAEVEALLPDGLFLPLTPGDVQLLAPQVTFYGLDTLGIQLLGTSGWTEESVVQGVDSRHTDGVVAVTVRLTQDETEAFRRFRDAYERHFQRTLRNQVPAFGYDAAALLMKALGTGPRDPKELISALEEIRDFPGATGNLSVDRGWVIREALLVRIQDHELIYINRRRD